MAPGDCKSAPDAGSNEPAWQTSAVATGPNPGLRRIDRHNHPYWRLCCEQGIRRDHRGILPAGNNDDYRAPWADNAAFEGNE